MLNFKQQKYNLFSGMTSFSIKIFFDMLPVNSFFGLLRCTETQYALSAPIRFCLAAWRSELLRYGANQFFFVHV